MWPLTAVRFLYGSTLLLAPNRLLRGRGDRTARLVARTVGARLLVEAALVGPHASPRRLRAAAAVDATHAATMVGLAVLKPQRRKLAAANAFIACAFAASGVLGARRTDKFSSGLMRRAVGDARVSGWRVK